MRNSRVIETEMTAQGQNFQKTLENSWGSPAHAMINDIKWDAFVSQFKGEDEEEIIHHRECGERCPGCREHTYNEWWDEKNPQENDHSCDFEIHGIFCPVCDLGDNDYEKKMEHERFIEYWAEHGVSADLSEEERRQAIHEHFLKMLEEIERRL